MEILSHSSRKQVVITGTPKHVDNHLEAALSRSTNCEWLIRCDCEKDVRLDFDVITPAGLVCPSCRKTIDPQQGRWMAGNSSSDWAQGFCISQLMVPWINLEEILQKQADYYPLLFKNECLGLPTALGDHVLTRLEIEACCNQRAMARSLADVPRDGHPYMVAGLDWGADGPQATLNDIVKICHEFRVR